MNKDLEKRVKDIYSEIGSDYPDELKFVESGTNLVIPKTLGADAGSMSSGKDKGRDDDEGDGKGGGIRKDPRPVPGGEEDEEPKDGPELPPDEDPEKKKGKDGEDGDEGDEGEGEGDEGDESDEEKKGKKKKKKKGGKDPGGDEDGDDEDGDGDDDEEERKPRKGDRVIVLPNGKTGIVTEVTPDGKYKVREEGTIADIAADLGDGIYKKGGQVVDVQLFAVGDVVEDVDEKVGTYEENEIKVIPKDSKKPPKPPKPPKRPPTPPPPPTPTDVDAFLERLETIKSYKFRFPGLGKAMFLADLDLNSTFYRYQVPLVLHNRFCRSVFNKRKEINQNEIKVISKFTTDFHSFFKFCIDSLDYANGVYAINPTKEITIDVPTGMTLPSIVISINDLEDLINSGQFDIRNLAMANVILERLEALMVIDYQYYRIISLTAFIKPEFFGENWVKPHLDFIFNYFRENELGFSNIPSAPFSTRKLDNVAINGMLTKSLNIYNILRATISDDYKIYVFEKMRPVGQDTVNSRVAFSIISDEDVSKVGPITDDIVEQIMCFYMYSPNLRNNYENKEIVLFNLQKLSNLQMESYSDLLGKIDSLIQVYEF